MKHLKLFENFDENDPFGEEMEYIHSDGTFLTWLKQNYPDETTWNKIRNIKCDSQNLTNLYGIEKLTSLKLLGCWGNWISNEDEKYLKKYYRDRGIRLII